MLERLQDSAFSQWVVGSESLLAYPTILTLHTIGLALVVGAAAVVCLRALGVGTDIPTTVVRGTFRVFWVGFVVNLTSGVVLFAAEATDKAAQPVFFVKLILILAALVTTARLRRVLGDDHPATRGPATGRRLAGLSLLLWSGAIVAGRLMAYL